jgi:hypothetical protein
VEQTSSKFRKVQKSSQNSTDHHHIFFGVGQVGVGRAGQGRVGLKRVGSGSVGDLGQVGVGSERIRRVTSTIYVHSTTAHDHPAAAVASARNVGQKRRRATQPSGAWSNDRAVGFPFFPKTV